MSLLYHLIPSDVRVKFFSKQLRKILGHVRRGHANISREFEPLAILEYLSHTEKQKDQAFHLLQTSRQTMVNHILQQVRHVLKTSRFHIAAFLRSLFFFQDYKGATLHSLLSKNPAY